MFFRSWATIWSGSLGLGPMDAYFLGMTVL
jgi:hypothetical protein